MGAMPKRSTVLNMGLHDLLEKNTGSFPSWKQYLITNSSQHCTQLVCVSTPHMVQKVHKVQTGGAWEYIILYSLNTHFFVWCRRKSGKSDPWSSATWLFIRTLIYIIRYIYYMIYNQHFHNSASHPGFLQTESRSRYVYRLHFFLTALLCYSAKHMVTCLLLHVRLACSLAKKPPNLLTLYALF